MKKFLFSLVAPMLSMVSMLVVPVQAAAESCCPPPCCDPCEDDCNNGWMEKLGLLVVAAGAGALAGWGASQANRRHHHHGSTGGGFTGATGATGPGFDFTTDTLTFTLGGTVVLGVPLQALAVTNVYAFVSTPNGEVVTVNTQGSSIGYTGPYTVNPSTISITDAALGTYTYGFVFPPGTNFSGSGDALTGTVTSSRTGADTTYLSFNSTPDMSFSGDVQIVGEFVYGSTSGPSFP